MRAAKYKRPVPAFANTGKFQQKMSDLKKYVHHHVVRCCKISFYIWAQMCIQLLRELWGKRKESLKIGKWKEGC